MKSVWKASLLGGLTVFLWSNVSWMMLPFHRQSFQPFQHEADVMHMMDFAVPASGIYLSPHQSSEEVVSAVPLAFVSYSKEGMRPLKQAIALSFFIHVFGAFVLTLFFRGAALLTFGKALLMGALYGLAIGFVGYGPNWVWWHFSDHFTLVAVIDCLVGWTLAGAVIGKVL